MKSKKFLLLAFIVMAIFQLGIPAKMVWDREDIITSGKDYKFKTAPVDPNDPFRGKYITLRFDIDTFTAAAGEEWKRGETVYVSLTTDQDGFAKIQSSSRTAPTHTEDYIAAKVGYTFANEYAVDFPFDRFYMEESKAKPAEDVYWSSQSDTTKTTYALVSVKNGGAVLKDVLIDGVPIRELISEQ